MRALLLTTLLVGGCATISENFADPWIVGAWCPEPDNRPPAPEGQINVPTLSPVRFHPDGRLTGFEVNERWRLRGHRLVSVTEGDGSIRVRHRDRVERLGNDRMIWTKNYSWRTTWRRCASEW